MSVTTMESIEAEREPSSELMEEEPFQPPLDEEWERQEEPEQETPPEDSRLARALELNREVMELRAAYETAAESAKAKKKRLEAAQEALNDYLASLTEKLPLFDREPEKAEAIALGDALNGAEGVQLATVAGFPRKVLEALEEEHGITAIGQLAAWTRTNELTSLRGVGQAKADAASDALAEFWRVWNEKSLPKPAEASNEEPAAEAS